MGKTVLEYVQATLSAMDSDDVDSIDDTMEATQVANQLKEEYAEYIGRQDWAYMKRAITLNAVADPASPASFTIPEDIKLIEELSYNVSETGSYKRHKLRYLDPQCFLDTVTVGEGSANATLVEVGSSIKYFVRTDRWPTYWTSFDEVTVVMDAVNQDYETTLTTENLQGFGVCIPAFQVEDGFVPYVPLNTEPALQAQLNKVCFHYFKQVASVPDEEKSKRQLARQRREASKVDRPGNRYYRNQFGRK